MISELSKAFKGIEIRIKSRLNLITTQKSNLPKSAGVI